MALSLNNNAINSVLQNMFISQQTFANPIGGLSSEIVDGNRVDGTLYGDQKIYTSVDMIHPFTWTNDSEAANLLTLHRNKRVKQETVTLDQFKMFANTTDEFLSKQAFMNEGNFANYNAVLTSMIRDGLKAYDTTTYNTYIGTHGSLTKSITVGSGANEALTIAEGVANILDEMSELSTAYNTNGYIRAFGKEDVDVIFNNKYINRWRKVDLPVVFHKDGILGNYKVMNQKYFGRAVDTTSDVGSGKVINASDQYDSTKGTLRFCKNVEGKTLGGEVRSFYAGDEVPTKKLDGTTSLTVTIGASKDFAYTDVYVEDSTITGLIIGKGAVPYMSAAESSTAFWNPRSLTTTNYLIFGRNTLKALGEKPYVIIKKA